MTAEQQQDEYNRLPPAAKETYDYTKKRHPNWSHEQIMTKVGMDETLENMVDNNGGKDVDPSDPTVLVKILEGGKRFLEKLGINLSKIMEQINAAIFTLKKAISWGISNIGDRIKGLLGWLFE